MHFLESADDDYDKEVSSFKNLISNFIIPFDIKNDIVYCQKSFRIYLKVHQIVITHYGERIPTLPKVKKLMYDLEREIYQINAEQKFLIIRLRRGLEEFYYNLLIQYDIKIDRDYGTQYINKMFTTSMENIINDLTLLPIKVKKRRSLEQWLLKFGIDINFNDKKFTNSSPTSSLKLLENLQLLPSSLPTTTGLQNSPEMKQIMERIEPRKSRKQQQLITKTEPTNETDELYKLSYNNIPENLILKQVSLLKPKSERSICNDDIDNDNIKAELSSSNESNLIIDEDEIEIDKEKNKIEPITIKAKESTTTEKPKVSMSINTGRMNLLQALNKAKCQNQQIMSTAIIAPTPAATSINPKSKLFKFKKMPLIGTGSLKSSQQEHQYQQNSKPSTSKLKNNKINYNNNSVPQQQRQRSTSSDDSSGDNIKIYPNLKTELPEPTEYNQEMFLRLFGLNTIAHSIYLQQRRSKRRRRNVQSNERKDFHYGNLEISSEQMAANKEKKKKIFLVSPTANRNIKRKQIDKNYKYKGRISSSPEDKILCNQCSKNGDYGLSRCEYCRGYFHAKCHQGAFARRPLYIREKICPKCFKAQKSRSTSTDDQSRNSNNTSPNGQISLLKELHGKLSSARSRKNSLLKESETFKTKMNELFTIVSTMKKGDSENVNANNLNINKKVDLNTIGTDQLKCQEILIDDLKCNEMIINDEDDDGGNDNDDDENNKCINNKTISEEQNKFDEIMMLIHDNNSDIRKITTSDDYDDEQNDNNLYEIYDSDISNQGYDNDIIMIIPQNAGDDGGNESIYEIQENSHDDDSTDIEMIEE